jgi:hypothetical protein
VTIGAAELRQERNPHWMALLIFPSGGRSRSAGGRIYAGNARLVPYRHYTDWRAACFTVPLFGTNCHFAH